MRSAQRRDVAWDEMVSGIKLDMKSSWQVAKAESEDRQRAIDAGRVPSRAVYGDVPHMILTLLTGGLWGPVWLFVWWRNERRVDRIAMGEGKAARRHVVRQQVRLDQWRAAEAIRAGRTPERVDYSTLPTAPPSERVPWCTAEPLTPAMWWTLLVLAVLLAVTVIGLVVAVPLGAYLWFRHPWRPTGPAPSEPVSSGLDAPTVQLPVRW